MVLNLSSLISAKALPADDLDRLGHFEEGAKATFLTRLWGDMALTDHDDPFFRHYRQCCNLALSSRHAHLVSSRNNADVLRVVDEVKSGKPRDEVVESLAAFLRSVGQYDAGDDEITAECLLALTLRTCLMCNLGSLGGEVNIDQRQARWEGGSIQDLLKQKFSDEYKVKDEVRLERSFKARNLETLASIEVLWTDNLLDHLRLHDPSDDGKPFRVSIFHHTRFLEYHKKSNIFPPGFIAETTRTLALLLPGYDKATKQWFQKERKKNKGLDETACMGEFLDADQRTIQSFVYWRDRLAILKQAYDESEPRTFLQWWKDGRNSVQWATFWVAVLVLSLTIFFGVVQNVEGALQVYKAYHPG
jgi:hypothetical protein